MKRIIAAILALVLAITVCGCTSTDDQSTDTSSTTNPTVDTSSTTNPTVEISSNAGDDIVASVTETEVDVSLFREVETSYKNIEIYRAEVQERLNYYDFLTPAEEELIYSLMSAKYSYLEINPICIVTLDGVPASTYKYYFPVIFREGNSLILWYTNWYGNVCLKAIYGDWLDSNFVGRVHTDHDEEFMYNSYKYWMTYDTENSVAKVWKFGQVDTTYELPAGSIYCGFSDSEGYIFRCGTDVYALDVGTWEPSGSIKRIATDVEYVILANYGLSSDRGCQPLFLMTDGTIKCYVSGVEEPDSPADDPSHLYDLGGYEGGYYK